ncbi:Ergothioneine biosynthesis protein 1 [Holothuria leucospilota]|uniref:Ergothioneine biosynthesis protein 1 n=1 Tax=Holothuria leucospilota TaxID=206669 RepID=A0A9Q1HD11_HOLLE|nr:Ergothioneine biosynthesis protein 1 [Holothuria leucospilota]
METIFETGVDEMNWDDTENYRMGGSYKWPVISDVVEFRRKVRSVIRNVIENATFHLPVTMDNPYWALFMGMEHERIHLETSSVLIRQLPIEMVRIPPKWNQSPVNHGNEVIQNEMVLVPECEVILGKPFDFPSYGWDNEYPQIQSYVPEFEASKFLVTNGEYLEFISDGGYEKMELWSNEGWQWKLYRNAIHPTFWVCSKDCKSGCGGALSSYSHCGNRKINGHDQVDENENIHHHSMYRLRTVCEEIKMPWLWPVEVNCHEAQAYCRWKGKGYRLLTEAEHNAIRDLRGDISAGTVTDPVFDHELHKRCNLNLAYCSSTPVNHYPPNSKGFHDVFGNVWQWTEDHFNGFPGTKTSFLYDDFSTPCFDGKHNIIMGGSWISTGDEASRFARYSFRRHFFQHAGFRLARSRGSPNDIPLRLVKCCKGPMYEISCQVDDLSSKFVESTNYQFRDDSEEALKKQLMIEYWPAGQNNFYSQLFQLCQKYVKQFSIPARRALNINTGCGRMTFELCRDFSQLVPIFQNHF